MLRTFTIGMMAAAIFCLSGCKNDSESAMSSMIDKIKEMTSVLKGIKDKDSLQSAKPKLEALHKEMGEVMTKVTSGKQNNEEWKKASEKYKAEGEEAMNAYVAEMTRVAQLPGAAQVLGSTTGLPMGGFRP